MSSVVGGKWEGRLTSGCGRGWSKMCQMWWGGYGVKWARSSLRTVGDDGDVLEVVGVGGRCGDMCTGIGVGSGMAEGCG